ncbi:protein STPG3 [Eublepharis macularius]|uniref:Protein STPG3 n=1 Tax=Eublepharis macularius TaxID=481883 RepID=A0AA97KGI2_EUBMA|nr:protein STPG3 [Eublepharis macularius]
MEFRQIDTKFKAQQYLNSSQPAKTKGTPLLYKRHLQNKRTPQTRQRSTSPLFPDIHSGVHSRATESRLPLTVNVDSPGPAAYPPPSVNCRETTAPSYTFGWKTPSKEGGGRRSWQKTWFQSKNPFTMKADFNRETNWPSPFHYGPSTDSKPANRPSNPGFTFGQKGVFSLASKDAVNKPAPNKYNTVHSYEHVLQRSPSFVISPAPQHPYRWASKEGTPGPGTYNVEHGHTARLPSSPSFFIQGVRRPKKHETGPFSTL